MRRFWKPCLVFVTTLLLIPSLPALSAQTPAELELSSRLVRTPDDLEVYFDLIRLYAAQGRFQEAEAVLAGASTALLRAEASRMPGLNEVVNVVANGRGGALTATAEITNGQRIVVRSDWRSFVDMADITVPTKDAGVVTAGSYERNPNHALLSAMGFFRISQALHDRLVAELALLPVHRESGPV